MKSIIASVAVAAGLMVAGSAMAVDMPASGKAKCAACHKVEGKAVGPGWADVAKKYAGDKEAESKIAANITKGGEFGWKMGKMPPKGLGASDADIKELAHFIAGLK